DVVDLGDGVEDARIPEVGVARGEVWIGLVGRDRLVEVVAAVNDDPVVGQGDAGWIPPLVARVRRALGIDGVAVVPVAVRPSRGADGWVDELVAGRNVAGAAAERAGLTTRGRRRIREGLVAERDAAAVVVPVGDVARDRSGRPAVGLRVVDVHLTEAAVAVHVVAPDVHDAAIL